MKLWSYAWKGIEGAAVLLGAIYYSAHFPRAWLIRATVVVLLLWLLVVSLLWFFGRRSNPIWAMSLLCLAGLLGVWLGHELGPDFGGPPAPDSPVRLDVCLASEAAHRLGGSLGVLKEKGVEIRFQPEPDYGAVYTAFDERSKACDVWMIDDPWVPKFADRLVSWDSQLLKDIGVDKTPNQLFERFVASLRQVCWNGDQLVGLPLVGNVMMLLYQADALPASRLEQLGLGKPEFLEHLARSVATSPTHRGSRRPLAVRLDTNNDAVEVFCEALRSTGREETVDAQGHLILPANAQHVLDWLLRLELEGSDRSADELIRDLLANRLSAAIGWPAWVDPGSKGTEGLRALGVSPSPVLGAWLLAIPKTSQHRREAATLILELTSASWQEQLLTRGNVPVLEGVDLRGGAFWHNNSGAILDALRRAKPRPRARNWSGIEAALGAKIRGHQRLDRGNSLISIQE